MTQVPAAEQVLIPGLQATPNQPIVIQIVKQKQSGCGGGQKKNFKKRAAIILGSLHIFLGLLSILFNALGIRFHTSDFYFQYIGYGFWTPVLWFIAGGFGLGSAYSRTSCMIVTFLVMSIISSSTLLWYLTFACIDVIEISQEDNKYDYDYGYYNCTEEQQRYYSDNNCAYIYYDHRMRVEVDGWSKAVFMDALVVMVAVCEGIVCILSAVLCCHALCCGASRDTIDEETMAQVRYIVNQAGTSQGATAAPGQQPTVAERMPEKRPLQGEAHPAPGYNQDPPPPY